MDKKVTTNNPFLSLMQYMSSLLDIGELKLIVWDK